MAQSNQVVITNKKPTEKMALWKIIVLAVSLTIIAALIVTIIVFACVKVNLTPNVSFNPEEGIIVNFNTDDYSGELSRGAEKEEAITIISKLKNGFSTSMLNCFTMGLSSNDSYDINYQTSGSTYYNNMKSNNKYLITFMFTHNQELKTADGETFKYGSANAVGIYRQMVVLLNDDNNGFGELEIWFFTQEADFQNNGSSRIKLTAYGNFSELLSYLDNLAKEVY